MFTYRLARRDSLQGQGREGLYGIPRHLQRTWHRPLQVQRFAWNVRIAERGRKLWLDVLRIS